MTRGWGPWRFDWYSICSAHRTHDPACDLCTHGMWQHRWSHRVSSVVHRVAPRLWRWWVNR